MAGVRPSLSLESPGSSELNEEEESPEPDVDYMDEYDSEEEKKQKRKKRPPPRIRGSSTNNSVTTLNTRASKSGDTDKPFLCNCESVWCWIAWCAWSNLALTIHPPSMQSALQDCSIVEGSPHTVPWRRTTQGFTISTNSL